MKIENPKQVENKVFDVCIIGAGVAGLTITQELVARGLDVCLIESGAEDYKQHHQDLNEAENIGFDYYKLIDSRLRMFGGTTAIWGGRCAPLDEIDFKVRPWVPHSGWPITMDDLYPYYQKARVMLGLPKIGVQEDEERKKRENFFGMNEEGFEVTRWEFDKKHDRFQASNMQDIIHNKNVYLLLEQTVVNVHSDLDDAQKIDSVTIVNPLGARSKIKARAFVLATGGLENPRLMLNVTEQHPQGLGNEHGLVGRFFMEHPRVRAGAIHTKRPLAILKACYRMEQVGGVKTVSLIRPTDAHQEELKVLNNGVTVLAIKPEGSKLNLVIRMYDALRGSLQPSKGNRFLWRNTKNFALWLNRQAEPYISAFLVWVGLRQLNVVIRAEQAPNVDSKVILSAEKDHYGMYKMKLDWRFSEIDKTSIKDITESFGRFLTKKGLGHITLASWLKDPKKEWENDPLIGFHHIGGYHHMGTTRMAASPKEGVVDKDCKIFSTKNMYVAGCSVFPTGGWGNPTLTIAALAARLGEHLAEKYTKKD